MATDATEAILATPIPRSPKIAAPPLTRRTKFWYAFGQIAEGIKNHAFTQFLLFFYTQALGLPGSMAAKALFIALLFDAVTDPLVGVISDRLHSRWGRRHPFMYAAAVPMGGFFYLVFAPPEGLGNEELFGWLLVTTVLTRAAMTLYHVPHLSMGAELSTDYIERTQIVQWRSVAGVTGAAIAGGFALLLFFRPSSEFANGQLDPTVYGPMAALFSVLITYAIFASAYYTHDRIPYLTSPDSRERAGGAFRGIFVDMAQLLALRSFRAIFLGQTITFIALGMATTVGLYVATYFWRVTMDEMALGGLFSGIGIFFGLGFWPTVAARIEKKPTFILGLAIFTAFAAVPYFAKLSGFFPAEGTVAYLAAYCAIQLLWAIGISATMPTGGSMMADVTDEDELLHSRRREGVFFGAMSFSAKCSAGFGVLLTGYLVEFVGLKEGMKPEEVTPLMSEHLGLAVGSCLLVITTLAGLAFSGYELTRADHKRIRDALTARENGEG